MLIDTHCHINMLVKKEFDVLLTQDQLDTAHIIQQQADAHGITHIINVGTSLPESINCVELAKKYNRMYAAVGIHPNDCTANWLQDFKAVTNLLKDNKQHIVAIGETGLDRHYPDFNLLRQIDAFKAHIELALEHDLALIVHTRDARDETLRVLEQYNGHIKRGVIHCFSENQEFANDVIAMNFVLGIGGTITYPKNNYLRDIVKNTSLDKIVLETDTPFLPPQVIRGKKNHPQQIKTIACYIAELKNIKLESVAQQTTETAQNVFRLK